MGIAPTPFDPDAPSGGVQALVRRNPDNMTEIEMVKAVWGSDPRFNDGINYRFVRGEGRAFPARRCLIPASEFRMGTGDHRYRVTPVWVPPRAVWPLSCRFRTIPAGAVVIPCQSRHGVIIQRRGANLWLDGSVPNEVLFEEPPRHTLFVEPLRKQAELPL